jgi:hypothetical protein
MKNHMECISWLATGNIHFFNLIFYLNKKKHLFCLQEKKKKHFF